MLTDTLIRKSKTPAKPTKLSDERGLYLLCGQAAADGGASSTAMAERKKLRSLGIYPEASVARAREAREAARRQLAAGIDPSSARQEEKARKNWKPPPTTSRRWLASGWRTSKGAAVYHGDTAKRFEAFVFPTIGRRPIASVAAAELLPLLRKIEARGTMVTAHRVLRACGQVFHYGIATGRCERNPAADLRGALKALPRPKHMAALSAAAVAEDEARRISDRTKAALQAAKARGRKLGSPVAAETAAKARAARSAYAAKANATILAVIREMQGSGVETLAGIARTLRARDVKTLRMQCMAGRTGVTASSSGLD